MAAAAAAVPIVLAMAVAAKPAVLALAIAAAVNGLEGRPLQVSKLAPVNAIGRGLAGAASRVARPVRRPATRKVAVAARARAGVGRHTQVRHPSGVDAPALVGVGRATIASGRVKLSVASRAPAASAVVRTGAPLVGAVGLAEAAVRAVGAARAVAGVAAAPLVAAVGPAVPMRIPALARVGPPRGRSALEAALPRAPSAMEVLPRRAALAVALATSAEAGAAPAAALRGTAVGLPRADAAGLRIPSPPAIRATGSAIVPAVEVPRRPAPVRQGAPTVGPAVVRLGQPTRIGLLEPSPRARSGANLASEANPGPAAAPAYPAGGRAPTRAGAARPTRSAVRPKATAVAPSLVARRAFA